MNILLLAPHPFFQHRGTPIAVRLLAEVLTGAGHQVDMVCFHEGQDVELEGLAIHRISAPSWLSGIRPGFSLKKVACDLLVWREARKRLQAGRYDLIHAVEEAVFMARGFQRRFGVPYVYDMDSSLAAQMQEKMGWLGPLSPLMRAAERRAVRGSVGVVAVCQALGDLALRSDATCTLLCLEDISLLGVESLREEGDDEQLPVDGPVVMYVGNLETYQGIDLLLESFSLVTPAMPEARLVVIGGQPPAMEKYRAMAAGLGITDQVLFAGPRPPGRLGHFLSQATVVVSPRIKGENTPMKVYSYLDSGRPLLATRLPTHTQVLDDEISLLVEPTPPDMAKGLMDLLGDPDLRQRLAGAARQRVAAQYSLPAYRRKLLDFYQVMESKLRGQV